jgi:hypothetical protein
MAIFLLIHSLICFSLLFLDVLFFGLFEQPLVYFLLAYSLAYVLYKDNAIVLAMLCATLSIESVLFYNRYGLILAYGLPVAFLGHQLADAISARVLVYTAMVISCFCIQYHLMDPFILQRSAPGILYTIGSITGTLIIGLLFSLKLKDGRQGNRF